MKRAMLAMLATCFLPLLMMGCAELQSGLESVNQELSQPADSGGSSTSSTTASSDSSSESTPSSSSASSSSASSSPAAAPSQSTDSEEAAVSSQDAPMTKVHVTLDGQTLAPDAHGLYWTAAKPVSATPEAVMTLDESLGELDMCILNIYEFDKAANKEKGSPWIVTDTNVKPRLMQAGKPFNMANPGDGATIITPDSQMVKACEFKSGTTYVAVFSVKGMNDSWTTHVVFDVK